MARQLKKGESINGYTLVADSTTSGAGTAQWAFVRRGELELFMKQYLYPVYPDDDAPGTPAGKAKRRAECERFETRVKGIEASLGAGGDGGFLIRALDFFCHDGFYYKVTEKLSRAGVEPKRMDVGSQRLVLLTVAYSLKMLHAKRGLVHADLKPDNIIIHAHDRKFVAKIIDFDSAFSEYDLRPEDEVTGDQIYRPPEMVLYLNDPHTSPKPTQAIDVFALGLVYCQYLAGSLPALPKEHAYLGEALLDGFKPKLPKPCNEELEPVLGLIERMLAANPADRPSMAEVHTRILERRYVDPFGIAPPLTTRATPVVTPGTPASGPKSKLKSRAGLRFGPDVSTSRAASTEPIALAAEVPSKPAKEEKKGVRFGPAFDSTPRPPAVAATAPVDSTTKALSSGLRFGPGIAVASEEAAAAPTATSTAVDPATPAPPSVTKEETGSPGRVRMRGVKVDP